MSASLVGKRLKLAFDLYLPSDSNYKCPDHQTHEE